jgi:ABC-type ATPase with predicted acetyltransferase domain
MNHATITLPLRHTVTTAVQPSPRVCQVAAMFGLGVDERKTIDIVPAMNLPLVAGEVVFITGASGSGKTTLMRLIAEALDGRDGVAVIDFAALDEAADEPLVDGLGGSLNDAVRWLSLAGLNDAFVMLRKPSELSDGQRYRLRLARAMAAAEEGGEAEGRRQKGEGDAATAPGCRHGASMGRGACGGEGHVVVLADEFGATLDRLTAMVVARNVRKWVRRSGRVTFVAATTHDDLLEPLDPDVLVVQHPGKAAEVVRRAGDREQGAGDREG